MKNIHIIPTENYSDLVHSTNKYGGYFLSRHYSPMKDMGDSYQYLYITNSEEIKEGDWFLRKSKIHKLRYNDGNGNLWTKNGLKIYASNSKKIILTTDQDLITDGVQAIDDEFLEWFVKNPSCEFVEIHKEKQHIGEEIDESYPKRFFDYKSIIPQEEPKQETTVTDDLKDILAHLTKMNDRHKVQETLEEALSEHIKDIKYPTLIQCSEFGAKWRQERSYSEEEVRKIAEEVRWQAIGNPLEFTKNFEKWFETNKKK
jgi:hypothetical protein